MKASIIVCTFNRAEALSEALGSLSHMRVPSGLDWEVLVVDNNSTDSTRVVGESFAQRYPGQFRYIFEGRQGKSFALNTGVKKAKGEILVFTDDDVTVDPQWLGQMVEAIETFGGAGAGGKIAAVWNVPKPSWFPVDGAHKLMPAIVTFDFGEDPIPLRTAPFGANMAFRREVFEAHGGFRTDLGPLVAGQLGLGEDSEFGRRLLKAGKDLVYAPRAVVYHPVDPQRIRKSYFRKWYFSKGRASIRECGVPVTAVRYFGVPRYLYLAFSKKVMKWFFCLQPKLRFYHKLEVCETIGQILEARELSSRHI